MSKLNQKEADFLAGMSKEFMVFLKAFYKVIIAWEKNNYEGSQDELRNKVKIEFNSHLEGNLAFGTDVEEFFNDEIRDFYNATNNHEVDENFNRTFDLINLAATETKDSRVLAMCYEVDKSIGEGFDAEIRAMNISMWLNFHDVAKKMVSENLLTKPNPLYQDAVKHLYPKERQSIENLKKEIESEQKSEHKKGNNPITKAFNAFKSSVGRRKDGYTKLKTDDPNNKSKPKVK